MKGLTLFAGEAKLKMMKTLPLRESGGQTLLVIILLTAVALTIGLSVTSRSITDIKISQQTEEAARAFSAAEAGIEEALITQLPGGGTFAETGATYQTSTANLGEANTEFAFPGEYTTNEIQTLWFANQNWAKVYDRNQLKVLWAKPGTVLNDRAPALEVSIYYNDGGTYKVGKFVLDPFSGRLPDPSFCNPTEIGLPQCQNIINFSTAGESCDGQNFKFTATLNLGGAGFVGAGKTLLFARERLLYSDTAQVLGAKAVGTVLSGLGSFPSQGIKVESVGRSESSTRQVEVTRLYPAPPAIFDFVLSSGVNLTK